MSTTTKLPRLLKNYATSSNCLGSNYWSSTTSQLSFQTVLQLVFAEGYNKLSTSKEVFSQRKCVLRTLCYTLLAHHRCSSQHQNQGEGRWRLGSPRGHKSRSRQAVTQKNELDAFNFTDQLINLGNNGWEDLLVPCWVPGLLQALHPATSSNAKQGFHATADGGATIVLVQCITAQHRSRLIGHQAILCLFWF